MEIKNTQQLNNRVLPFNFTTATNLSQLRMHKPKMHCPKIVNILPKFIICVHEKRIDTFVSGAVWNGKSWESHVAAKIKLFLRGRISLFMMFF